MKGRENYETLCKIRNSLELMDTIPKHVVESYKRQQSERSVCDSNQALPSPTSDCTSSLDFVVRSPSHTSVFCKRLAMSLPVSAKEWDVLSVPTVSASQVGPPLHSPASVSHAEGAALSAPSAGPSQLSLSSHHQPVDALQFPVMKGSFLAPVDSLDTPRPCVSADGPFSCPRPESVLSDGLAFSQWEAVSASSFGSTAPSVSAGPFNPRDASRVRSRSRSMAFNQSSPAPAVSWGRMTPDVAVERRVSFTDTQSDFSGRVVHHPPRPQLTPFCPETCPVLGIATDASSGATPFNLMQFVAEDFMQSVFPS